MASISMLAAAAALLGLSTAQQDSPYPTAPRGPDAPHDTLATPLLGDALGRGALRTPASTGAGSAGSAAARVETALDALRPQVERQSHPDALRLAFRAYFNYRAAHPAEVRKPYLYFVDFGLGSGTARGYVFDMEALTLVDGPFPVAHGRGSSREATGVPVRFTNIPNSATSSLGLYLTQETYAFRGTSSGRRYRSIGLRLSGQSGRFNSAARARGIVVHGAPYVTSTEAGRSEGCPAMEERRAQRLIPMLANGSVVFLFSPLDAGWMRGEPWAQGATGTLARGDS